MVVILSSVTLQTALTYLEHIVILLETVNERKTVFKQVLYILNRAVLAQNLKNAAFSPKKSVICGQISVRSG